MTDLEYDILDELYFVVPFQEVMKELELDELTLKGALKSMLDKGWVKCFLDASEEAVQSGIDFESKYRNYYYLASKQGLLKHNGR